jgi:hypothetical protein
MEAKSLRSYLVSIKAISAEDAAISDERDNQSRRELALLKASQFELEQSGSYSDDDFNSRQNNENDDDEGDECSSEDDDSDGRHENDSNQGSNNSSWNGSNEGSLNGETSGESMESNSRNGSDSGGVANNGNKANDRVNNSQNALAPTLVGTSESGSESPNIDGTSTGSKSVHSDDGECDNESNENSDTTSEIKGITDQIVQGSSYASLNSYESSSSWRNMTTITQDSQSQLMLSRSPNMLSLIPAKENNVKVVKSNNS